MILLISIDHYLFKGEIEQCISARIFFNESLRSDVQLCSIDTLISLSFSATQLEVDIASIDSRKQQ